MEHDNGIKDRDDRSSGIEILMTDDFAKIKPTDPFRLTKQVPQSVCVYLEQNKKRRGTRIQNVTLKLWSSGKLKIEIEVFFKIELKVFMLIYYSRIKKERTEDKKCHTQTMMRIIGDKTLKKTPTMCRLGRTWRKENEGRRQIKRYRNPRVRWFFARKMDSILFYFWKKMSSL